MLHHTADCVPSLRCVLQEGVDLIGPISVCQHVAEGHARGHVLPVQVPRHPDISGVEVVSAAHEHGAMAGGGGLDKSDVGFS